MTHNQSLAELSSRLLTSLNLLFSEGELQYLIIQGDTTTAYIGTLAAFYNKLRIAHVEAGLRTYNKNSPWPEEMNRRMISLMADYHFAPTKHSVDNLAAEGITKNVILSGNTDVTKSVYIQMRLLIIL
jgi:UDP-N-acetylglucosamine 2-epimerase (non-hydrolysing)